MRWFIAVALCVTTLALGWVAPVAQADDRSPITERLDRRSGFRNSATYQLEARDPGTRGKSVSGQPSEKAPRSKSESKGSGSTGPGSACIWEGTGQFSNDKKGPVPCTSEYGIWSNRWNCYVSAAPVDPQPPATASEWDGHSPDEGAIYSCYSPAGSLYGGLWLAEPPDAADVGPTPGEVAQIAVERMNLDAIKIGMSPGPDSAGIVGQPTWLWAHEPSEHTVGPITRKASAGSVTVTATARLERIVWDMGDGKQVVCTGAGTPYTADRGMAASPDCGHTYTRESGYEPGRQYTVTATSEWVVEWTGAGQSGSIDPDGLSRSVQVSVGEAQVLVS